MTNNNDSHEFKQLTLQKLYHNQLLFSKVKAMLEKGCPYKDIVKFLNVKGYTISTGSLTNLKHKLEEAERSGISVEQLLDKRKKTSITQANVKGYVPTKATSTSQQQLAKDLDTAPVKFEINPKKAYWSDNQVLDEIIEKGVRALDEVQVIDLPYLIKAIEIKERFFNKDTKGLTIDAIKQYEVLVQAQMAAVKDVVAKYVPEDQQDAAYAEIHQRAQEAIDRLTITPEAKSLLAALQQAGLKV